MHENPADIIQQYAGFLPENIYDYREIIRLRKHVADAHKAATALEKDISSGAPTAEKYACLGFLYLLAGQASDAIDCYTMALHLQNNYAGVHAILGEYYLSRRNHAKAIDNLGTAIRQGYTENRILNGYGKALVAAGETNKALVHYEKALRDNPDDITLNLRLADLLKRLGDWEAADKFARHAMSLDETNISAVCIHGENLRNTQGSEQAIQFYDSVLERHPDYQHIYANRALSHLSLGRLEAGWRDYEARYATHSNMQRPYPYPRWDGDKLTGKGLLVYGEQGLGDEIMFASCLPDVIDTAENCVIECNPKLAGIFKQSFPSAIVHGSAQIVRDISWLDALPPLHYQIAIGSLPRYFRNRLEDFPAQSGYLQADADRMKVWQRRLDAAGSLPKIGIAWRSSVRDVSRNRHYTTLLEWASILSLPDVTFVNLQYGDTREELDAIENNTGVAVLDFEDLDKFDDLDGVAALIACLDLVICVGISTSELAGALGIPVWKLGIAGAWTSLGTGKSPWFPKTRLFSKASDRPWSDIFPQLKSELIAHFRA